MRNFNLKILEIFKEQGFGFEVVSKGELKLALLTKINPKKIIFNGNGKTYEEVKFAIENGVEFFNFDSLDQLLLLEETAKELNKTIKALMRIKPLVDVETHSHLQIGPICESSDVFGEYFLPNMKLNELLIIENCGAYGYSMSSNYNGREKPLETLIENDKFEIINERKFL